MEPRGHSGSWRALQRFNNNQSCRFARILLPVNLGLWQCKAVLVSPVREQRLVIKGSNELNRKNIWCRFHTLRTGRFGPQRQLLWEHNTVSSTINYPLTSRWFGWLSHSHSEAHANKVCYRNSWTSSNKRHSCAFSLTVVSGPRTLSFGKCSRLDLDGKAHMKCNCWAKITTIQNKLQAHICHRITAWIFSQHWEQLKEV